MKTRYSVGQVVDHPIKAEWGPGKIVDVKGDIVHVFFKNYSKQQATPIKTDIVKLVVANQQSDPILDNLPPLKEDGGVWRLERERLTFQEAVDFFLKCFPMGFEDENYLGDKNVGERNYKLWAHEKYLELLGDGNAKRLFEAGETNELTEKIFQVESSLNLLSPFERMALKEALTPEVAAKQFFNKYIALLEADHVSKEIMEPYFREICDLPQRKNGSRVATWPNATIFPYLARPDKYMFLKPEITKEAAAKLGFNLSYKPAPNWNTYSSLMEMVDIYWDMLAHLKPKDLIDIQSFFFVTCSDHYR